MSVATENTMQINHTNNFYQQSSNNANDWATKRKSFGDDSYSDADLDNIDDVNNIDGINNADVDKDAYDNSNNNASSNQVNNVSTANDRALPAIDSSAKDKSKSKSRKKATNSSSPIIIEPGQNTTIRFELSPAEHNKLTAIATLLGYEKGSDFAKELFLNSLNPYFSVAAQSLRQQLFQAQPNEVNQANFNQANFNQLSQTSQYSQAQASHYVQANDANELNYSNEQQQT